MKIAVVIPTMQERADQFERASAAYNSDPRVSIIPVYGTDCVGRGWQIGAEIVEADGSFDLLHLTNDDIEPAEGAIDKMVDACARGMIPVPLIANPRGEEEYFEVQGRGYPGYLAGGDDREYPSLPFCTVRHWMSIGPMVPQQYGTDRWFGFRARQAGVPLVCTPARFIHHEAPSARVREYETGVEWTYEERLTFDVQFGYAAYATGKLSPKDRHEEWDTYEGREMARQWLRQRGQM